MFESDGLFFLSVVLSSAFVRTERFIVVLFQTKKIFTKIRLRNFSRIVCE